MVDSWDADRGVDDARCRNTCSPPHLFKYMYEVDISIQATQVILFCNPLSLNDITI
jgi:hypothetical protein